MTDQIKPCPAPDGPDAPYPGMAQAFERHYSQSWRDKDWSNETSVWAASWKACIATSAAPQQAEQAKGRS